MSDRDIQQQEHSASDVVAWMVLQIDQYGSLYQASGAELIERNFGSEFVYTNKNGSRAISRKVCQLFRKQTGNDVIWKSGGRFWRRRFPNVDRLGRKQ